MATVDNPSYRHRGPSRQGSAAALLMSDDDNSELSKVASGLLEMLRSGLRADVTQEHKIRLAEWARV